KSRLFLYELIATLQACTCVFENGLVLKYYGIGGFFIAVICLVIAHGLTNRGALITPLGTIEALIYRSITLVDFLIYLAAEICGGYLAFRFARHLWWIGISPDHSN